jgi:hypothetical protein
MRTAEVFASLDLLARHTSMRWPFEQFKQSLNFAVGDPFARGRAMAECPCVADCIRLTIPQATEWQRIGD